MSRVFLDIDGVLADFHTSALELWPHVGYNPAGEWAIATVLGITEDEFWSAIDNSPEFWPGLQPYEHCQRLIDGITEIAGPPHLLSKPSKHHSAWSGKAIWAERHFPKLRMTLTRDKSLLANSGRVLIDDSDKNVREWKMFGPAILFPRPWNANHTLDVDPVDWTLAVLRASL